MGVLCCKVFQKIFFLSAKKYFFLLCNVQWPNSNGFHKLFLLYLGKIMMIPRVFMNFSFRIYAKGGMLTVGFSAGVGHLQSK